jgi:hypothetical protein
LILCLSYSSLPPICCQLCCCLQQHQQNSYFFLLLLCIKILNIIVFLLYIIFYLDGLSIKDRRTLPRLPSNQGQTLHRLLLPSHHGRTAPSPAAQPPGTDCSIACCPATREGLLPRRLPSNQGRTAPSPAANYQQGRTAPSHQGRTAHSPAAQPPGTSRYDIFFLLFLLHLYFLLIFYLHVLLIIIHYSHHITLFFFRY